MHAFQLRALIEELQSARYDGITAQQAWAVIHANRRYVALQALVFLSRQEAGFRRQLGLWEPTYRIVPDEVAGMFPEGIPGMPAKMAWQSFQLAWREARGQRPSGA